MTESEKTEPRKVFVVDDHELMRIALAQLIDQESDLIVCGLAEGAEGALTGIDESTPDVALVDLSLKDSHGIELIKDIRARWPELPVLVLSMHDESFYAERALRAGARGYVTKAEASTKVIDALRGVLAGNVYVSEAMTSKMLSKFVGERSNTVSFPIDSLSDREFEVFEMIGQGLQSRQIARRLHLSAKTVDAHREHIKRKLGLETATDLLVYAVQWSQFEREA